LPKFVLFKCPRIEDTLSSYHLAIQKELQHRG
jgi:hypothetical protein